MIEQYEGCFTLDLSSLLDEAGEGQIPGEKYDGSWGLLKAMFFGRSEAFSFLFRFAVVLLMEPKSGAILLSPLPNEINLSSLHISSDLLAFANIHGQYRTRVKMGLKSISQSSQV